ncbi:XRE family transcriptional regulator [Capnocytophaga catalasegens]|uniref:HTH cro/C1-type domain-containing protein n=1 Tax=Capnocytophaga catalasegens TaxID=1004260 RepID=A0AAV5AYP7_9FLAO|nr:XRE family transcriptional regulator [Capnocytophaga catalasegens]GIZ15766.1 hypothetical protein RCZ03_17660 [Capnocytophaga catalasegens]GJM51615.1 hypothetical protein RCZ15_25880 [Capnocytophaga catalasegens]GJM54072.1 hypothetical protein RCZ16_23880 [Capnocytophaga catalasegens]
MIKERVIQVIEIKGIAKEKFFEKIGVTSANFRGNAKKTPLNSTTIENILSEIPELNPEWLLTGKGSMLKTESKGSVNQNLVGDNSVQVGGSNNGKIKNNTENQFIKELQTEIENLKILLIEKEKQLTEKEKQISKLIDKLTK